MNTLKRIINICIILSIILTTSVTVNANARTIANGTCGENLKWTLDDAGTLTISGTGEMTNWSFINPPPWWCNYKSNIKSIVLEPGITSISYGAFFSCNNLTEITIPDSVTSIGNYAFNLCRNLANVTIGNRVTNIGNFAFYRCNNLTNITISNSVKNIGDWAFSHCSGLTNISIPDSVITIGDYAFYNCINLTSIAIPNSVTNIGERTFSCCDNLTSITIPDSIITIGKSAFSDCYELTSIDVSYNNQYYSSLNGVLYNKDKTNIIQYPEAKTDIFFKIPDGVKSIEKNAFKYCKNLRNIAIPDSVANIEKSAFSYCYDLININVNHNNKCYSSVYGVLFNKDKISLIQYPRAKTDTNYIIPNTVTQIEDMAFNNCTYLVCVTIGNRVKNISYMAFNNCYRLANLTIPNSVTIIDNRTFDNCTNLTNLYYGGTKEGWDKISIGKYGNTDLTNADILFSVPTDANISYLDEKITVTSEKAGTLYIAEYENNKLKSLVDYAIIANTPESFDFDKTKTAFIWDKSLKPLCIKFEISKIEDNISDNDFFIEMDRELLFAEDCSFSYGEEEWIGEAEE